MKLKEIIGVIFMVILTVCGIILSFGISVNCVLSSDGILNIIVQADYLKKSEQETKIVLNHYMTSEKTEEILKNVSIKSAIKQITEAFDTNTVSQVASDVKNEMKQTVINSLEQDISQDTKIEFAEVVSEAYVKSLLPVTELSTLSRIHKIYSSKLVFMLVILAVISVAIYIYLATGRKTYKWAIIAMYNVIILNIILIIVMGNLNGIVIGNERTTDVVISMLNRIKINVFIATVITFSIVVISNYIEYFRKRKHSK